MTDEQIAFCRYVIADSVRRQRALREQLLLLDPDRDAFHVALAHRAIDTASDTEAKARLRLHALLTGSERIIKSKLL